eukprot:TRINITY_DN23772_c0_g2_i10.p2 TRINITY_DN23772_c0_g2~~TRINITY_DN23772_c0_g2_i10.p2  ORF type:complete len:184 (-),score=10.71 TRINITY_DN23772_c0_g2_i10:258-809(-)
MGTKRVISQLGSSKTCFSPAVSAVATNSSNSGRLPKAFDRVQHSSYGAFSRVGSTSKLGSQEVAGRRFEAPLVISTTIGNKTVSIICTATLQVSDTSASTTSAKLPTASISTIPLTLSATKKLPFNVVNGPSSPSILRGNIPKQYDFTKQKISTICSIQFPQLVEDRRMQAKLKVIEMLVKQV